MEAQKAPHSNRDPEKGEQSWRNHATLHETLLQGHSNENSMVLA